MRIEKLERDLLWSVLGDEFKKFGIFQPIFIGYIALAFCHGERCFLEGFS